MLVNSQKIDRQFELEADEKIMTITFFFFVCLVNELMQIIFELPYTLILIWNNNIGLKVMTKWFYIAKIKQKEEEEAEKEASSSIKVWCYWTIFPLFISNYILSLSYCTYFETSVEAFFFFSFRLNFFLNRNSCNLKIKLQIKTKVSSKEIIII